MAVLDNQKFAIPKIDLMRILPLVNLLLTVGLLAVVSTVVFIKGWNEYSDQATESIFILHSVNGFLLLVRAILKNT